MSLRKNTAGNTKAYFQYVLRHNWQQLIFYGILMLLVVVLPVLMMVHETRNYTYHSYDSMKVDGSSFAALSAVLSFITSCGVAVFASMSAFSYVNSKQAVGCFHSFPLTRSTIFFTETAVKGIYYLVSHLTSALISYSIVWFNFPISTEANTFYFQMLLLSVLGFALFYSIGIFAAGLTGTGLLRFLMFGVVVAFPIAVYLLICAAVNMGMPNVDIDAYIDFEFIKWLCPVTFLVDMIMRLGGEGKEINYLLSIVLTLIPIAAFYGAGYFLHLKRKSETSGTPIIWKPLFVFIKYAVIFLCTLGGELFFGAVSGEEAEWYFFGGFVGFILSFMLTNVILYRSVRSMFKGVKGAVVMAVGMIVFSALTVSDGANMNAHMWSAVNTRSLTVTVGEVTVEYTDEEDIDTIVPLLREYLLCQDTEDYNMKYEGTSGLIPVDQRTAEDMAEYLEIYRSGKYYEYYDEYGDVYISPETAAYWDVENPEGVPEPKVTVEGIYQNDYDFGLYGENYRMTWKQVPYAGIPSCKKAHIPYVTATKALFEYIIASEEYAAAVNEVKELRPETVGDMSVRLFGFNTSHFHGNYNEYGEYTETVGEYFKKVIPYYSFTNEKRLNSPVVGRIRVWADQIYYLPVYAEDYELINILGEWYGKDFGFRSAEDVYRYMADQCKAMFLIDKNTRKAVSLTEEQQKEIVRYLPYADVTSDIPCETDGKYIAVGVCGYTGEIFSYATPVRSDKVGAMAQFFMAD